ncbi:DUF6520 family protein [Flavobacterium sp. KMS]|uniref:DUF6520 family protein n=1 Tax=unclassified Flavobacterium TaxID=196869 RepID=UPI00057FD43E|nr:DUF6520 family protein [Flavobacterium sp. KMS]KIA95614.1 hypothetical protein OA93_17840 [Flavobacterium sp. KMS]
MKAIILKKMMPAAVFVLAISGAFLTTSMQSDAKVDDDFIFGYVTDPLAPQACSIQVVCSDEGDDVCRRFDETGPQAFGRGASPTICPVEVYRPE